jgi:hypothetical protein
MALELSGSINISGSMTATTIIVSAPGAPGMVSSSNQLVELNTATGSLIEITNGLMGVTASLNLKTGSYATTGSNTFMSQQTFSGSISASGTMDVNGITLAKNNNILNNTMGSISYHDVVGLTLQGRTASVFDFSYYNPQGNAVITNAVNSNNISFNTGSVIIGTGDLKFNTAGRGIDFSANSNAAGMTSELLNDYEEGTFTPTLGGDSTYTTQFGNYTKIGNKVYFKIILIVNLIGTGDAQNIYGLPFTCDSTAVGYPMYVGAFQDLSSARVFMAGRVGASGTTVAIRSLGAAAVGVNAANVFQNGSTIEVAGFYGV